MVRSRRRAVVKQQLTERRLCELAVVAQPLLKPYDRFLFISCDLGMLGWGNDGGGQEFGEQLSDIRAIPILLVIVLAVMEKDVDVHFHDAASTFLLGVAA